MNNLASVIKEAIQDRKNKVDDGTGFECKYCHNKFRKESTLFAHICEPKRRSDQEKERGVQLGLQAYLRFYEFNQGSAKYKTYNDFSTSPYYKAFIKFGRHVIDIRAVDTNDFIDFLLTNNKKLDHWCQDKLYNEYLMEHLRRERMDNALERSLSEMEAWAKKNNSKLEHFFLYAGRNLICQMITNGRISPWVIYNSLTGVELLDKLTAEQIEIVFPWIDPHYWKKRFVNYMADTELLKVVLREAGI